MIKYVPKKKPLIFFVLSFITFIISNLFFLFSPMLDNLDLFLLFHLLLLCTGSITIGMALFYTLHFIENTCCSLPLKQQINMLRVLSIIDIVIGVVLIYLYYVGFSEVGFSQESFTAIKTHLESSIYFKTIETDKDLSSLYLLWSYTPFILLCLDAVLFFIASARNHKTRKKLLVVLREEQERQYRNEQLGFEYETSDYYQQTLIPFSELEHKNGSLGEFEMYHQLVNSNIPYIRYLFNREIPKNDGLLTEIDLIVIHPRGLIVIENKDYCTLIYGKATDYDWTIIDHSGQKKSVYNPIRQNRTHIQSLKEFLIKKHLIESSYPIYSIVSFTDMHSNRSDDIISRIDVSNTDTKICTSQNIGTVVETLLNAAPDHPDVNIEKITDELSSLSIHRKQ